MSRPYSLFALILAVLSFGLFACGDGDDPAPRKRQSQAQFTLIDRTPNSGLTFKTKSGTLKQEYICEVKSTGVGLMDYDKDGFLDIVLVAGSTLERARENKAGYGVRLFRNLGNLKFEDVSDATGMSRIKWGWACAPICADVDGDGDDDLYVTQIGRNVLLINNEGVFEDHSKAFGLDDPGWGTSAAFADIDGDGDLDLYLCNYLDFDFAQPPEDGMPGFSCKWKGEKVMCGPKGLAPQKDVVFRNDGRGRFSDAGEAWGLTDLPSSYGLGVIAGDFDSDGNCDLYVANDAMANFLLRFDAETQKFKEEAWEVGLAVSEDGAAQAGMGLDACDLNGDGIEDIVCTNFSGEVNNLYMSDESGFYLESSATAGTALGSLASLGWGVGFIDFDLDGKQDLFVANGHVYPQAAKTGTATDYPQFNQVYVGEDDNRFRLLSQLKHPALAVKKVSRGAAFGDLDNDGDVDVIVCNLNDQPTLIENKVRDGDDGPSFIGVSCQSKSENTQGLGASVSTVDGKLSKTIRRHASFQSTNDGRVVFAGVFSAMRVRWPSGKVEIFNVKPNTYNNLVEGAGK